MTAGRASRADAVALQNAAQLRARRAVRAAATNARTQVRGAAGEGSLTLRGSSARRACHCRLLRPRKKALQQLFAPHEAGGTCNAA